MISRLALSFVVLLVTTVSSFAQPQEVKLRPLFAYNLEPKFPLEAGNNCIVFTAEKKFFKAFGILPAMPKRTDAANFATEDVLVLAAPPATKETTLKILRAIKAGNFIEVYCSVNVSYPLTYVEYPIALAAIPKYKETTIIKFYDEKRRLLKEVKIR